MYLFRVKLIFLFCLCSLITNCQNSDTLHVFPEKCAIFLEPDAEKIKWEKLTNPTDFLVLQAKYKEFKKDISDSLKEYGIQSYTSSQRFINFPLDWNKGTTNLLKHLMDKTNFKDRNYFGNFDTLIYGIIVFNQVPFYYGVNTKIYPNLKQFFENKKVK